MTEITLVQRLTNAMRSMVLEVAEMQKGGRMPTRKESAGQH